MRNKKVEYYIVDKRILPKSIQNVIKIKELIENENISKYAAIKKIGISRSTYYKYKDLVSPFFETNEKRVYNINMLILDEPGSISRVLEIISNYKLNILTVIQNIPINGKAYVTVAIQTSKETAKKINKIIEDISNFKNVENIRIIGTD